MPDQNGSIDKRRGASESLRALGRLQIFYGPAEKSGAAITPARILIVEDDYFVALELEHSLSEVGFEVIGVAGTAEEALKMAASGKPALAVMDIRLNGPRDGIDTAIELLTVFKIPSIFATAHSDPETTRRAEKAKPLGWLEKPYTANSLIELLNKVLAQPS